MALVRYTQGFYFNGPAKTLDISSLYPTIDFFRVKQIRRDNSNITLYRPGTSATATFANGIVTFTGVDTTKMQSGEPVSVLYDEPDNDSPFASAVTMASGVAVVAGRAVWVVATTAGSITLTLAGGGTVTLPVAVGLNTFPVAATQFVFANSAAGTVYNMA